MTWLYRAGLVLLAATFGALAASILLVDPVITATAVTSNILNAQVWAVLFLGAAVLLAGAALADADRAVGGALAVLMGLTSAYAFAAWSVVIEQHTGWQVASRVTALAVCHGLLYVRGPELQEAR